MTLSAFNVLVGLLVIVGTLFVARRLEKRWGKITACILGALSAGTLVFYPSLVNTLSLQKIPSDAEILSLLYGDDVPIQESLDGETVYITEQLSSIEREQFNYANQVNTQVVYKRKGWNDDPQSVIVLTRTGPLDCCDRSLSPVLGGAVITKGDHGWQVSTPQKWITPYYNFDLISSGKFIEISSAKIGLLLIEKTQNTEINQTWDLILGEIDGRLKVVAKIQTGANNENTCVPTNAVDTCWMYESAYVFVQGSHPDYDEIHIQTEGTKIIQGVVTLFSENTKLFFSNGEYRFDDE